MNYDINVFVFEKRLMEGRTGFMGVCRYCFKVGNETREAIVAKHFYTNMDWPKGSKEELKKLIEEEKKLYEM